MTATESGTNGAAPLAGLRVLDCADGIAGQHTGRMFAGFGAQVTLVERAGGATTRSLAPFKTLRGGGRWSLLFEHLNAAKTSFEFDGTQAGREALDTATRTADVVIRDAGSVAVGELDASTVDCVIRDFPERGAYAHWQSSEMVQYALSGTMYQTGRADDFPLYGVGHRSAYAAGTTAYVSTMAALWERRRSGLGQTVDTSVFESVAAMGENLISMYSYSGTQPLRRPIDFLATLPCADGWVMLYALTTWPLVCEVFDMAELADDERFVALGPRVANWDAVVEVISKRSMHLGADEVVARCQERRILAERAADLAALTSSEVWRARGMVVTHDAVDPTGILASPVTHAMGPLFRVNSAGWVTGAAPVLGAGGLAGEHADQQARDGAGDGAGHGDAEPHRVEPARRGPLAGLRVVDLTTAWSGPFATRALGFLGAQVIKIEAPKRLDTWRGWYLPDESPLFPDWKAGERRYNRCVSFNTQGINKRSVGLDVTAPGGRDIVLDLLASTDVLVANFSSGVLGRLGLGSETLRAAHPHLVVVEMPAFGAGTASSGHVAMGSTMEAAAGMAALIGYGDGQPFHTGATMVDPSGGLNGAAAVLVGLWQRGVTGEGCHIEVAQTEAASHWIGEYVLAHLEGEPLPGPRGNEVVYAEPHDVFRCAGNDQWVAIAVGDDAPGAWRGLCATLGRPDLADDSRFATFEARRTNRDELAEIITAFTGVKSKLEVAAALQANGVPAAPVNRGVDVFFDPTLRENTFMVELDHPEAGSATYPGLAYRLSRTPGSIWRRAPLYAEDNHWLVDAVLGYSPMQVAELYDARALCDQP